MTIADLGKSGSVGARELPSRITNTVAGVRLRRGALLAALVAGAAWGWYGTGAEDAARAVAGAGEELTQLLRFMALMKAALALGAVAAVLWRLGAPASPGWMLAYLASAAALGAGPGLIWGMAHVGLGAVLLHGGLLATLLLVWRDPAVATRLGEALATRRSALAHRRGTVRRN